jgi:hypothetical protein
MRSELLKHFAILSFCRTYTAPGIVVKVNLTDFRQVDSLELMSDENYLLTSVVSGHFAYFG